MKTRVGLAFASGLFIAVAGCASTGGGGTATTATGPAVETGQTIKVTAAQSDKPIARTFNVAVKCPGVAYLKKKGWSDQEIMQQLQLMQNEVGNCQAFVADRPKGYVPPPPGGTAATAVQAPAAPATKTQ
jgi:hypothetical protein